MVTEADRRSSTVLTDPVAVARELRPLIRDVAADTERERRLAPRAVEALRAAGLFQMLVPRDMGGHEIDPVIACRAIEEVALADGSAGWCVMIAAQNCVEAGFLPVEIARRIVGDGNVLAGTASPNGRAIPFGDGTSLTVTGTWTFASGSSHATWLGGECVIYDNGEPRKDANGNTVSRMVFFPAEQAVITDTWHTTGLRGTASNTFTVEDLTVPIEYGFDVLIAEPSHPWPLYRALPLMFVTHGSHAVGVARAALETAKEIATTKVGWGTDRPMSENPRIQAAIAEATADLESARHYMYAMAEDYWRAAQAGEATALHASRARLATSHAGRAALRTVDRMYSTFGTAAIFEKSPLERQFRDMHTAAAHVMIGSLTFEAAGRVELGIDAGMPFF